jgi:L-fuconolactonase
MQRRTLLRSGVGLCLATALKPMLQALGPSIPVIDTHIHLFDPTRPGGVPWPEKTDKILYKPALPSRYKHLSQNRGVVGAIAIECSPWLMDNFWLQDVIAKDPMMLGFVGDLMPEAPDFAATFHRLHQSPFFLGLRYGNLWNRDLGAAVERAEFLSGLHLLAATGLVLEVANPDPALIAAVLRLSDRIPNLRIVIDHLPHASIPTDAGTKANYEANLRTLSQRKNIFVKGSEIIQRIDGAPQLDLTRYKASLDELWDLFGEDRIFFGSDWPNSDSVANYDETFVVAQRYIATRSIAAQQKYFWKNSIAVYDWKPRTTAQAQLKKT